MAQKTVSTSLRNRVADARVLNLDGIELLDAQDGTVLGSLTGITWNAASGGKVVVSGTPTISIGANAGTGTECTHARLYDSGTSGDELDNLVVAQDQNFSSWGTGVSYSQGDKVTNVIDGDTFYFVATEAHTSASKNEPGVGETWRDFWQLQDVVISNTNLADGDQVDINSMILVEPDVIQ